MKKLSTLLLAALDRFAKANGLPEINWEEENDA